MQSDAGGVDAERFDRLVEHDLAAVDAEAAGGDHLGQIARGDRAVQLAGVAGLADGEEGLALELAGDGLGFLLQLEVARLQLGALAFEAGEVILRGAQSLLLRQEEVAGVAVLDVDHVAETAPAFHTFEENDFHVLRAPYFTT